MSVDVQDLFERRLKGLLSAQEKKLLYTLLYGGGPAPTDPPNPKASTTAMDEKPKELPKQDLLLKLLNMTTSSNDGEKIIAIDKANALLKAAGWTWEKLLQGKITVVADPFSTIKEPPRPRGVVDVPTPPSRPRAPTPPPRPAPPPPPRFVDLNGQVWSTATAMNNSNQQILAQRNKPKGLVNSTLPNRFPGDCWCCGDFADAGKGWLFKPIDFNSSARTTARKLICTKCNDDPNLKVPPSPARGKSAVLADLI